MVDSTGTNSKKIRADIVKWQQCLEREYSLRELRGLCLRLGVDPENIPHATKPELSRELVGYLHRRNRMADLEAEHEKHRANRRDTLDAYRLRLLKETQYIELKGIPIPSGRNGRIYEPCVLLDKVYIQVQALAEEEKRRKEAAENEALKIKARETGERKATDRIPLDFMAGMRALGEYFYRQGQVYQAEKRPQPVDPQVVLAKHKRLVILGSPGSGKSTLLRFLARRAAENEHGLLPILVPLRDFSISYNVDRSLNLYNFALKRAAEGSDDLHLALEATAEQEQVLWLLDALDETYLLADEVARQASRLPGSLLLTSRPVSYSGKLLHSLPHFEILPLTPETVDQFLYDWMVVFAGEKSKPDDVEQWMIHLQAQLDNRPQLKALTRNPLLLTFMVALASQKDTVELPQQRANLYALYLEKLRDWEIERQKQTRSDFDYVFRLGSLQAEKAKLVAIDGLNYLGWALHLNYYGGRSKEVPTPEMLTKQLACYLEQDEHVDAQSLATDVLDFWQEAGMLDFWQLEHHTYLAFRHLTFQEYAAAWSLNRAWQRNQKGVWHFLKPRLHHPSWREPILLWSSLMPAIDIYHSTRRLRQGVSRDERTLHRDLLLAGTMLSESQRTDEKIIRPIANRLAWLGRSHKKTQISLLLCIYAVGLIFSLMLRPFYIGIIAMLIWSAIFGGSFYVPVFPRLRTILGLPLRIRGLVTVPFISVYSVLTSIGGSLLTSPHLFLALQDMDDNIRKAAAKAFGEIVNTAQIVDVAATPHLIIALQSKDRDVCLSAIEALGKTGDVFAIPHLILTLQNEDLRWAAVHALSRIGDAAIPHLITALQDEREQVRRAAIEALGQIGNTVAIPHLITALRDKARDVRFSAINTLGQIGDTDVIHHLFITLQDNETSVRLVARALSQIGDTAIPHLIAALQNEQETVRWAAVDALSQIGEAAIPHLITALQEEREQVRRAAIETLGQIGNTVAIPHLITALHDESVKVRCNAATALGLVKDASAIPYLCLALQDKDMRWAATVALGQIGDTTVGPDLNTALQDDNIWVRYEAADALGSIGDTSAVPDLIIALEDEDVYVRGAASQALSQCVDASVIPDLIIAFQNGDEYVRKVLVEALGQIEENSAIPYFTTALEDKNEDIRKLAVVMISKLEKTSAIPFLFTALQDENERIRRMAAMALGEIGGGVNARSAFQFNVFLQGERWGIANSLEWISDVSAVPYLITALQNENVDVRWGAVGALGQIGDVTAVPHLITALQDQDQHVRQKAVEALGKIGDATAVPHLIAALQNVDKHICAIAATALGQIRDTAAIPHLITLLQDGEWTVRAAGIPYLIIDSKAGGWGARAAAAEALGQIGDTAAVPYLITALHDEDWGVGSAAADALGQIGDAAAVPHLITVLQDEDSWIYREALQALVQIGDIAAVPHLITALQDENMREAATEALGNISMTLSDLSELENIRRILWWHVTDISYKEGTELAKVAQLALEKVVGRLTELSAAHLTLTDPLGPLPAPHPVHHLLRYGLWIVSTAIIAVLIETAANLLSNVLGSNFPAGLAGALVLISALILFLSINRKLES